MTPDLFFATYAPSAVRTMMTSGVPASITLAQAALESSWGESLLSKNYNNYFGIKDSATDYYTGGSIALDTTEWINGSPVKVSGTFRAYSSAEASFTDHAVFLLSNPRYANLFNDMDYKNWANELQADGYATDPAYASKLISIIESHNLQSYDVQKKKIIS